MFNVYKVTSNEHPDVTEILFVCEYRQERERICEALSTFGLYNAVPSVRLDYLDCAVAVDKDKYGRRFFKILTIQETMTVLQDKHLRKTEINPQKYATCEYMGIDLQ